MANITMPSTPGFRRATWTPMIPAQVNRSEWTGRRQAMYLPGAAYWTVSAELAPIIGEANVRPWRAFFGALRGVINTFDMVAVESAQHGGATILTVASGAAGALSIGVSGMPAWTTFLPAGAMLTVPLAGGDVQLIELNAPLASGGSGSGTATFDMPLRKAAALAGIESRRPYARMSLDAPVQRAVDAGQLYSFAFSATEAY